MTVATILGSGNIVYGNAAVCIGDAKPLSYDNADRNIHLATTTTNFFTDIDARYRAQKWAFQNEAEVAGSGDTSSAGSGADAVVYLPAQGTRQHVLFGVSWSYQATPTSGVLTVETPSGTTVFTEPITAAGPNYFPFPQGLKAQAGKDLLVRLKDGSQQKTVSLLGHRFE
jgi:hypothetical protein